MSSKKQISNTDIEVLIEETGCTREEARGFLNRAGRNLTAALRIASREFKPLGVIKCRFTAENPNIYGLILLIFNSRMRKMLRHAAVSGCNPSIYEVDINEQWFNFEKNIYVRRLDSGSLREITQKIEQALLISIQNDRVDEFYYFWQEEEVEEIFQLIKETIEHAIKEDSGYDTEVNMQASSQSLNLKQFKFLSDSERFDELPLHLENDDPHSSIIFLETELSLDEGTPVRSQKLEPGDIVFAVISDKRDIGIYLSHLLGGRKAEEPLPISATVEDVKYTPGGLEIFVRFGPMIMGRTILDPKSRVGVLETDGGFNPQLLFISIAVAIAGLLLYCFTKQVFGI
ncbi:MAG: hypothetical protein GX817_02525 [Elusimicrobia bacterium]|nr:hypothetical protein [Elusimicrobiota bacterium]